MVKLEDYLSDDFYTGRKSSCDEDNRGVSQWSATNDQRYYRLNLILLIIFNYFFFNY